ncbi:hypothetical protein BB558_002709 [Smittium angustum]|uniref:Fanconi-associated nuclease n=1 Tax=Smittium angustum TaxID=133377 RepID=A0A2U1J840_SMIAN|nr:hypothetical protein BB558_002709 [Smittium angustum]
MSLKRKSKLVKQTSTLLNFFKIEKETPQFEPKKRLKLKSENSPPNVKLIDINKPHELEISSNQVVNEYLDINNIQTDIKEDVSEQFVNKNIYLNELEYNDNNKEVWDGFVDNISNMFQYQQDEKVEDKNNVSGDENKSGDISWINSGRDNESSNLLDLKPRVLVKNENTGDGYDSQKLEHSCYIVKFEEMVTTVLKYESHLFCENELSMIKRYWEMSLQARYLFIRLFLRKNTWIPTTSMEYHGISVEDCILELCDITNIIPTECNCTKLKRDCGNALDCYSLIPLAIDQAHIKDLREACELLPVNKLNNISKEYGISLKIKKTKSEIIDAICIQSKKQTTLSFVDLIHQSKRIDNIDKKLSIPDHLRINLSRTDLCEPKTVAIYGIRIDAKIRKLGSGRLGWIGCDGEPCSVEQVALSHYTQTENLYGVHSESSILTTLFSLLFWDIIFWPINGVFDNEYQAHPLDMYTDAFYKSRVNLIDERISEIKNGECLDLISNVHSTESCKQTTCVGVNWEYQLTDLCDLAQCLGPFALSQICRYLAQDYRRHSSGVPDIWLCMEH